MLTLYIVLGWSVVGCVAALLMGRAIAMTGDRERTGLPVAAGPVKHAAAVKPAKAA
jgi:hypothetical protein